MERGSGEMKEKQEERKDHEREREGERESDKLGGVLTERNRLPLKKGNHH